MRERLLNDIKNAMKNQNRELLAVLRMVKGAVQLEELNKKRELNDEEMIAVFSKQIKTRKESIVEFEKGGRQDLIDQTQKEIDLLSQYMPEQLSEDKVLELIEQAFSEIKPSSVKEMGKVMAYLNPLVKGKADMGFVSKKIREKLEA